MDTVPKLNFDERFRNLSLVVGEKQAREMIRKEYKAYELAHLDYQALIVVASMQQEFERLGIAGYKRTYRPELAQHKYYQRVVPGWEPAVVVGEPPESASSIPIETIEASPFQYTKEVNSLAFEIHKMYLGISHQSKDVLYSDALTSLAQRISGNYSIIRRAT